MVAMIVGLLLLVFAAYSVLPVSWSLSWWPEVLQFLKGGVPILALFIGLIALFIGVADIKDKIESKREEAEEEEEEKKDSAPEEAASPEK